MKRISTLIVSLFILACGEILACTTVVVSAKASASGRPIIWKQRDTSNKYNYLDWFRGERFNFTGIVASNDAGRESVWCGANDAGFAIMNSQSYGLSPLQGVDRPYEGMVMKAALEKCSSVNDFERLIESLPQPNGLEANFGVIDAFDGAAFFEVHDYGYERFDASDAPEGYLIRSNFSMTGRPGEGHGYERYERAKDEMAAHVGGFTPQWFIDVLGRDDLIARKTTVCSVAIEGVGFRERKNASCIWCNPGHPKGGYTVAAWVAAGDCIPEVLRSSKISDDGTVRYYSPMNELAYSLRERDVLPIVREAEAREMVDARIIENSLRTVGFDLNLVRAYNDAADQRYSEFCKLVR